MTDTVFIYNSLADSSRPDTSIGISPPIVGQNPVDAGLFAGNPGFVIQAPTIAWYFYFLVALITGYIIARIYLGKLLSSTFTATIRYNQAASMFNDNSQLQRQRDNALYAFYFLSFGFYLLLLSEHYNFHPYGLTGRNLLFFYVGLTFVVFISRLILLYIVGFVFYTVELFREHLYMGFTYNKLLGIVLIPLNFLVVFTEGALNNVIIYLSLVFLIILLAMKFLRGVIFSLNNRVFNLYLFLYLCALEIVPILLLYKWFTIIVDF